MRLDQASCRQRAGSVPFAVLATINAHGQADLVPITFALAAAASPAEGGSDRLISAVDHKPKSTLALARLANISANPEVTLLFDHRDPDDWDQLWWVRAHGRATVRTAGHERALLVARYPQYREQPPQGPVIEVVVHRWQGWTAT